MKKGLVQAARPWHRQRRWLHAHMQCKEFLVSRPGTEMVTHGDSVTDSTSERNATECKHFQVVSLCFIGTSKYIEHIATCYIASYIDATYQVLPYAVVAFRCFHPRPKAWHKTQNTKRKTQNAKRKENPDKCKQRSCWLEVPGQFGSKTEHKIWHEHGRTFVDLAVIYLTGGPSNCKLMSVFFAGRWWRDFPSLYQGLFWTSSKQNTFFGCEEPLGLSILLRVGT